MDETTQEPSTPVSTEPATEQAPAPVPEPVPSAPEVPPAEPVTPAAEEAPKTFEQRVEDRFLQLEQFLVALPHSIATVLARGSMETEEFAKQVVEHLFTKK